ncbi:MAG TPA: secretin N-terminal domain-containing protein, partial [Candidatus Brocadiaceae bacterium]
MFKNFVTTSLSIFLCLIFLVPIGQINLSSLGVAEGAKATEEKVAINFVDVAMPVLVNFMSKITGKNFIYDESLTGKVTIIVPSKITIDEAFDLFTSVLELKGYALVFTGTAYKIVRSGSIKQNALTVLPDLLRGRANESYIIRLIPLVNIKSLDVMPMLQPLISKEGYLTAFARSNAILLVDSALNIKKILNIVKLLDVKLKGELREIVYLKNAQAENIAQMLRQMKVGDTKSMPKPAGAPQQENLGLIADKRLNALILFGSSDENAEYKRLIGLLDVLPPEANSRINVYYLENAEATEIATTLEGLTKQQPLTQGAPQAGASQADSELFGRVSITSDKATNSLIIMASP